MVSLLPSQFSPDIHGQLEKRLLDEVEGSFSGRFGYTVCVIDISSIGDGIILPSQGTAQYRIKYRAIVFKPYKGQVLDAVVSQVNQKGFMAEVGPVNVFVSRYLIADEFMFDPSSASTSFCDDLGNRIEKGSKVRLRILGTQIYPNKIDAIGSIKEDYLGLL